VTARRQRIRDALTHLDDDEFRAYVSSVYAKDGIPAERIMGVINAIRDCQGVSRQQMAKTISQDALLSETERRLLLTKCFAVLQNEFQE
jgi:hypothetical protein